MRPERRWHNLQSPLRHRRLDGEPSRRFQKRSERRCRTFHIGKRTSARLKALLRIADGDRAFDRENSYPTRRRCGRSRELGYADERADRGASVDAATRAPPAPTVGRPAAARREQRWTLSVFERQFTQRFARVRRGDSPATSNAKPRKSPCPSLCRADRFVLRRRDDEARVDEDAVSRLAVAANSSGDPRSEKAAAAAARACVARAVASRWRQKARAETATKTATLTEMSGTRRGSLTRIKVEEGGAGNAALTQNGALTRELADRDEAVELLTEALGAATRERVAAQWRFSAKAAAARAEAASARRK